MPEPAKSGRSGTIPPSANGQGVIKLSARDKDRVMSSIATARQPSESMRRAVERYKSSLA